MPGILPLVNRRRKEGRKVSVKWRFPKNMMMNSFTTNIVLR